MRLTLLCWLLLSSPLAAQSITVSKGADTVRFTISGATFNARADTVRPPPDTVRLPAPPADTVKVCPSGWTCTPPAPPPPPPPPPPTSTACSGVAIAVGASWQAAVDANPPSTTFCPAPGKHIRQSVVPKAGDRFVGAPARASILDGENATTYAFDGKASHPYPANVVIQGLTITRYKPPYQMGMIRAGDAVSDGAVSWLVRDNEISYSVTGGVRLGPRMRLIGNNIHHNRAIGIVGQGISVIVDSNEIAWNNYLKEFNWGGEAGGTKFAICDSLKVRGNYSHDNWGPGLWTDIFNSNVLYENNRVEDNAGPGIYHEISKSAIIRNNTLKRNGFDFAGWIWGGGIQISTSIDVLIENNTLVDNKVGISVVEQDRGFPGLQLSNINVLVRNNRITQRTGVPAGAAADIRGNRALYYAGIKFSGNTYVTRGQNSFEWADGCCRSWAQWKAYGQDTAGSLTVTP